MATVCKRDSLIHYSVYALQQPFVVNLSMKATVISNSIDNKLNFGKFDNKYEKSPRKKEKSWSVRDSSISLQAEERPIKMMINKIPVALPRPVDMCAWADVMCTQDDLKGRERRNNDDNNKKAAAAVPCLSDVSNNGRQLATDCRRLWPRETDSSVAILQLKQIKTRRRALSKTSRVIFGIEEKWKKIIISSVLTRRIARLVVTTL